MRLRSYFLCSAVLATLTVTHAGAQSIVGAWTNNATTGEGAFAIVFLANGYYLQIQNARASNAPRAVDGFERGTYTWNPDTGAFAATTLQDLNGDDGLSSLNSIPGVAATIAGNVATLTVPGVGAASATRVTGASPLVGAWFLGDPATPNRSVVLGVFAEWHLLHRARRGLESRDRRPHRP